MPLDAAGSAAPAALAAPPAGPAPAAPGSRSGRPSRPARSRSSGSPLASRFTFAPACALASCQPPRWPQPCGSATVPGRHLVGHLDRHRRPSPDFDSTAPRRRPRARARAASSGCTRSACTRPPRMSSGALCIHELCERSSRRPISRSGKAGSSPFDGLQPRASRSTISGGAELHAAESCGGPSRGSTPVAIVLGQHDAVRLLAQLGQAQPAAAQRRTGRLRAGAQQQVEPAAAG